MGEELAEFGAEGAVLFLHDAGLVARYADVGGHDLPVALQGAALRELRMGCGCCVRRRRRRAPRSYAVITGSLVLTKTFQEKRIRIAFKPADERFEVADIAIDREPGFISDIGVLWGPGYRWAVGRFR